MPYTRGVAFVGERAQFIAGGVEQRSYSAALGVSATPRCSISPKRALWLPWASVKAMDSSSALKLVWRNRIGQWRRGGPSITALG
jgi:hypothetical protein